MRTVGTNQDVASAWKNGNAMRSHNGNFETNGLDVWSYRMLIGRTLPDGTKQVLNVSGVHSYSVTTSQHVSDLKWDYYYSKSHPDFKVEIVEPVNISRGYGLWRNFPSNHSINEYRVTSKNWKTEKGAMQNCGLDCHVKSTYNSFSVYAFEYIGNDGHVITKEQYESLPEINPTLGD